MSWRVAFEYASTKYATNPRVNVPERSKCNKAFKHGVIYGRSLDEKDPRVGFEAASFSYNDYNALKGPLEDKLATAFYEGMKWATKHFGPLKTSDTIK